MISAYRQSGYDHCASVLIHGILNSDRSKDRGVFLKVHMFIAIENFSFINRGTRQCLDYVCQILPKQLSRPTLWPMCPELPDFLLEASFHRDAECHHILMVSNSSGEVPIALSFGIFTKLVKNVRGK